MLPASLEIADTIDDLSGAALPGAVRSVEPLFGKVGVGLSPMRVAYVWYVHALCIGRASPKSADLP